MEVDYEKYIINLPVMPEAAARILSIAEDKLDISFKELESIIMMDPGLTAKILKIANSALYARQREIKSLQMAITLLGFMNIKSLVLLVTASNTFVKYKKTEFYQFFWKHSILTAFLSKHIAKRCNRKELADESFLGALLHDIGQVAFFNADQSKYQEILELSGSGREGLEDLEQDSFGMNHKELGATVLQKWNLPELYVDIAREHESLNITSSHKMLIIMISIADILAELLLAGEIEQAKNELLSKLFQYTNLKESDRDYYKKDFMEDLMEDPLFQECQNLFGIGG